MDSTMTGPQTGALTQGWITVTDADGTTRLESRWSAPSEPLTSAATHAA